MDRLKKLPVFEALLALLVIIPHLFYIFGNQTTVLDWFISDDAFYYFQTARNIAAGNGVTFDGITHTNGFHPLWMLVCIPIFALAQINLVLPLRLTIAVSALLHAGTGILLYRMGKRYFSTPIAILFTLVWVLTPEIHATYFKGGLESGINAFFIVLLWERLSAFNNQENLPQNWARPIATLGFLAALAAFSRLDNVFLVTTGGIWLGLRWWKPQGESRQSLRQEWGWRIRVGLAYFAPLGGLMAAYLAWNYIGFGTFTPVSGQIKLWWGTLSKPATVYGFPVKRMRTFWGQFFTADRSLGPWSMTLAVLYSYAEKLLLTFGQGVADAGRRLVEVTRGGVVWVVFLITAYVTRDTFLKAIKKLGLVAFFLGCFAQIVYYKAFGSVAQRSWYWVGETIFFVLALGVSLESMRQALSKLRISKKKFEWGTWVFVLLISLGLTINFLGYMKGGIRVETEGEKHLYPTEADWIEEHTQPGEIVAITGAGSLGYFSQERTIVNLDGLANSYEYFQHMQEGSGADYLSEIGIDYILGNAYIIQESNPYGPMLAGRLEEYTAYQVEGRKLMMWRLIP